MVVLWKNTLPSRNTYVAANGTHYYQGTSGWGPWTGVYIGYLRRNIPAFMKSKCLSNCSQTSNSKPRPQKGHSARTLPLYRVILSLEDSKLLSIKLCYWDNDLKIYIHIQGTMQNRTCSQSMLKLVSFHIQAHLNAFLQILEYFSQNVDVDGLNLLAYGVFELFDCAGCIFVHFALQ